MNLNFDAFEFIGLIAPGSVVVLVVALLHPELFRIGDPAEIIILGIVVAYIAGHLVSAIGNIAELLWKSPLGAPTLSLEEWSASTSVSPDQRSQLITNVRLALHRVALDKIGVSERSSLLKQIFLIVVASGHGDRLETFNGLFNLSRGLAVSFLIAAIVAGLGGRYQLVLWSVLALVLTLFRTWKFKEAYERELFQQFLLLPL
jgi:hypothetical protein